VRCSGAAVEQNCKKRGPKIAGFFVRVRIRVLLLSNCKEKEERAERK
jgi:hypothetical protein